MKKNILAITLSAVLIVSVLLVCLIVSAFSKKEINVEESTIKNMDDFAIKVLLFEDGINVTDENEDLCNQLIKVFKLSVNYNENSNNVIFIKYNIDSQKINITSSIYKREKNKFYVAYKKNYSANTLDNKAAYNLGEKCTKDIMYTLMKYDKIIYNLSKEIENLNYNLSVNVFIDNEKDDQTSMELTDIIINNLKDNYNYTYDKNSVNEIKIDMNYTSGANKIKYDLFVYKSEKLLYKDNYESGIEENEIDATMGSIVLTAINYLYIKN